MVMGGHGDHVHEPGQPSTIATVTAGKPQQTQQQQPETALALAVILGRGARVATPPTIAQ